MFSNCDKIIEIDLSKFDASLIIDMSFMFNWCQKLISLDLSNLNTSQVTNMNNMFTRCQALESLDLSMLNISKVKDMSNMFSRCMNLIYLNLSNFDTSKVSNMNSMFFMCSSLSSLDLSYFNTSETDNMINMFGSCELLNSLDLSNFDMTKVTSISYMFDSCNELEYVNFKNAKFNSLLIDNLDNVFTDNKNNLIVSLENENDFLIQMNYLNDKIFIYCNNNNIKHQIKYISYMKNSESNNEYICDIFGLNYFPNYDKVNEDDISYFDCYELMAHYYLDINDWVYKPCYYTCKKCNITGNEDNNKCLSCQDNFEMDENENCYKSNTNELLYNKTEIMQSIVSYIIYEFNIDDINSGKDKEIIDENTIVKLTSTINQKKLNEEGNNITI